MSLKAVMNPFFYSSLPDSTNYWAITGRVSRASPRFFSNFTKVSRFFSSEGTSTINWLKPGLTYDFAVHFGFPEILSASIS